MHSLSVVIDTFSCICQLLQSSVFGRVWAVPSRAVTNKVKSFSEPWNQRPRTPKPSNQTGFNTTIDGPSAASCRTHSSGDCQSQLHCTYVDTKLGRPLTTALATGRLYSLLRTSTNLVINYQYTIYPRLASTPLYPSAVLTPRRHITAQCSLSSISSSACTLVG